MKYFLDTEFLEGSQRNKFPKNLFSKNTKSTIDLISIGIVAEDGRNFYAISKEFNLHEAWNRFDRAEQTMFKKQNDFQGRKIFRIRDNILKPIWREMFLWSECDNHMSNKESEKMSYSLQNGTYDKHFTYKSFLGLLKKYGKSNIQISEEIINFVYPEATENKVGCSRDFWISRYLQDKPDFPEFYGYYSDYDWVVFCWLFGKMMDLPKGFPMYCIDLKQDLDQLAKNLTPDELSYLECSECKHDALAYLKSTGETDKLDFRLKLIEKHKIFPKQENEHNALSDAKWNKKLYDFLKIAAKK